MNMWEYEEELFKCGWSIICGVDEAGRGPLAGPVYAAAVILPKKLSIEGLNDSKKLSGKKRNELYEIIIRESVSYGIAYASVKEIDDLNILNATFLAMNRAIARLDPMPEVSLIDGNSSGGIEYPNKCIIKGDSLSASVAAASILAKVTRDRYMVKLSEQYPEYSFDKHKGYGTKLHYELIRKYGISSVHRKSFLKNLH